MFIIIIIIIYYLQFDTCQSFGFNADISLFSVWNDHLLYCILPLSFYK